MGRQVRSGSNCKQSLRHAQGSKPPAHKYEGVNNIFTQGRNAGGQTACEKGNSVRKLATAQAGEARPLQEEGTGSEDTKEALPSGDKAGVSGDQDSWQVVRNQTYNI